MPPPMVRIAVLIFRFRLLCGPTRALVGTNMACFLFANESRGKRPNLGSMLTREIAEMLWICYGPCRHRQQPTLSSLPILPVEQLHVDLYKTAVYCFGLCPPIFLRSSRSILCSILYLLPRVDTHLPATMLYHVVFRPFS